MAPRLLRATGADAAPSATASRARVRAAPSRGARCPAPRPAVVARAGFFGSLFGGGRGAKAEPGPAGGAEAGTVPEDELPFPPGMLDGTFLRGRPLGVCYRASRDGWDSADFHRCADFKGPTVVYAETESGIRFGGFNPNEWKSSDDYSGGPNAFLFVYPSAADAEPAVLGLVGGSDAAVFDFARGGPQWGADGLVIGPPTASVMGGMAGPDGIVDGRGSLREAKSRLGLTYKKTPGGGRSLFGEDSEATLREVIVFYAPELVL